MKGGGVAILIRSGIPHTPMYGLDDSLEIIGIKIESNEVRFDFYSLYSPPSTVLPYELFSKLETEKNDFFKMLQQDPQIFQISQKSSAVWTS